MDLDISIKGQDYLGRLDQKRITSQSDREQADSMILVDLEGNGPLPAEDLIFNVEGAEEGMDLNKYYPRKDGGVKGRIRALFEAGYIQDVE